MNTMPAAGTKNVRQTMRENGEKRARLRARMELTFEAILDDAEENDLEPDAVLAYFQYGLRNYDGAPDE